MTGGKDFFAIPFMIPALILDAAGILAGVALILTGNVALGVGAIVLGSAPLMIVMVRHAQNKGRGS